MPEPKKRKTEAGEKFIRVVKLFLRLSDTQVGVTTKEIAEELEVHQRSVERYIASLRDTVGLDVEQVGRGRYRLGDRGRLPAMQLTDQQAVALLLAARLRHRMEGVQDQPLLGALAQITRALRSPVVTRYLTATIAAAEQRPRDAVREQIARTVVDCFVQRLVVEITYRGVDGKESRRCIRPYFLEPRAEGRTIYIYAHDEKSRGQRVFRMDRILTARRVLEHYEVPESFDIERIARDSWGIWWGEGPGDRVVLRFRPAAVRRVRETPWHPDQRLVDLGDGGVELKVRVASEVEMRPWVLGWGDLVEVVAPRSLREFVAASVRRAAEIYAGDR